MADEKSRAQFETFIRRQPLLGYSDGAPLERLGAGYRDAQVDDDWRTWQASRAVLVVELPTTALTGGIGMAKRAMRDKCRAVIEACGIRVAPDEHA